MLRNYNIQRKNHGGGGEFTVSARCNAFRPVEKFTEKFDERGEELLGEGILPIFAVLMA
jgi:hypothetical protein